MKRFGNKAKAVLALAIAPLRGNCKFPFARCQTADLVEGIVGRS